jgi:hypothetical protein
MPWEMTEEEWDRERAAIRPETFGSSTKFGGRQALHRMERLQFLLYGLSDPDRRIFHRDVVMKAFKEGKPVPKSILKFYGLEKKP